VKSPVPLILRFIPLVMTAAVAWAADAPDFQVTAQERTAVIEGSIARLKDYYVFPDTAKKMEAAIRSRVARGEFRSITSASELAGKLTDVLREVKRDKHLRLEYFQSGVPPMPATIGPTAEQLKAWHEEAAKANFGFTKVERLDGNVGYVEIRSFDPASESAQTVAAAMSFLANTDGLIIDLRRSFGGDPSGVVLVSSYFFDEPTHLDDMYLRWPVEQTQQLWTMPAVPGTRFGAHKPVYVVTSHETFSGSEAFAYDLKAQKRVQIVGETTAGGAHLTVPVPVSEHFRVGVPFGRSINPITRTDWEGTGIAPDVAAAADQALEVAYRLALEKLIEGTADEDRKAELREVLERRKVRSSGGRDCGRAREP
jgi:hypothetical protein